MSAIQPSTTIQLRRSIPTRQYRVLAVIGFVLCLLVWGLISVSTIVDPVFLPSPVAVAQTMTEIFRDPTIWADLWVSFMRVTIGFLLSALVALPMGILIGSFKPIEAVVQPVTEFVRYVPVPALIPILMVTLGIGEESKWALIFIGTYFQLVLMVADEVRRVPFELLQVAQTLGATQGEIIRRVLWRSAMPGIFDALRLCNGWAWTYLIVAELVAANEGLGFRILKFSRFLQTPKIWVYLILLGTVGLLLDLMFRALNRRLFKWAESGK
ncbi:ABC transporter permease [Hyphomicrobium sp.]|uniref:ABC transporter permease n=1 Tax=Hyphomicrobium sp. TaxID=82 RepID=UPI001D3A66B6|nr:ABC transporter permease [Hyphomicrobium sp.]MBY0558745.1 ABC transporter permease [Hyphomicrobium sp.]